MECIGYLLANTKSYVKDKYPSKLDSFYGFLKPETKEVMQGAILSNKWYDLRLFQDCLEALNKAKIFLI